MTYRLQYYDPVFQQWDEDERTYWLRGRAVKAAALRAADITYAARWRVVHNKSGRVVLLLERPVRTLNA